MRKLAIVLLAICTLTACEPRTRPLETLPTPASVEAIATAIVLTQNAPPPPYNVNIAFPEIDANLQELSGWRSVVRLEFDGVFARTSRPAIAAASAEIEFNQLSSARRVTVETSGELLGQTENNDYEAVKLGPDTFLIRQSTCQTNSDASNLAAELRAGTLVGGLTTAIPAGQQATINGEHTFSYRVTGEALSLPTIRVGDGGSVTLTSGEVWFSPEHNVVVRFWVNLQVTNSFIFDRQLPVDGTVVIRYDLYDIGTPYNISVPFGC